MKTKTILASLLLAATATTATAGGILTNTNQSIDFLRNPARDGAIGLDGVYSNPAGVAFLSDGLHLGFNWQYAHQTRTTTWQNNLLGLGQKNNGQTTKEYEGVANAPFLPSLQAAWNKGDWSLQFNFSVTGGGGKCEFDKGIGSFETVVGAIANKLMLTSQQLNGGLQTVKQAVEQINPDFNASVPSVTGYDVDGYMKGQQYYFGLQLGAARKLNDHLSVYGGVRLLYGLAKYEARLNNIRVMNGSEGSTLPSYFEQTLANLLNAKPAIIAVQNQVKAGIEQVVNQYMNGGMSEEEARRQDAVVSLQQKAAGLQQLLDAPEALSASAQTLAPYANGMNLKSDQTGWGIAPVLGIDYNIGAFNFAAKYEFKTRMRMKNNSDLQQASVIEATNKYVDGSSVPEDSPALFTVGAQWSFLDNARLNLGYHHFFDTDAHWYNNSQKLLDGGTNEFLAGVEWDITPQLTVSTGGQLTRYQLTDAYMNDMSFVVDSYSFGLGASYKLNDRVKLSAAYFQTNYEDYNMQTPEQQMQGLGLTIPAGNTSFTRTNRVLGMGCEITL